MEVKEQGIKALLTLATTFIEEADPERPETMVGALGRASGVLRYIEEQIIGVDGENLYWMKAALEGQELAVVFASNFDLKIPGTVYLTLHEADPREGGEELLTERVKTFMVDLNGDGELVNVTTVELFIPEGQMIKVKYVGLWDDPEGGSLFDIGEMNATMDLTGPHKLTISPGGLRTSIPDLEKSDA